MFRINFISSIAATLFLLATFSLSAPVLAGQMMGYQRGHMGSMMGGPMMGGGNGMDCGYGMGMGGYGMGYGMGGYGMGYGMGGYMGGRMMGGYLFGLNLTKDQLDKIRDLRQKLRQSNFKLMTQMMDESDKLDDLYAKDVPNPKEVGKVYDKIFSIRREMIENHIRERNNIYALLTDEQKQEFKKEQPYFRGPGMMMY
jgi:Spy/CpxP family protein refolding chaperone